jgi:serine/threonine protein kinase
MGATRQENHELKDTLPSQAPPVPEHELLRLIGRGSGGEVWLARNTLGTFRAVKLIRDSALRAGRPFRLELNGVLQFEPVSRLHDGLVDILQVGGSEAAGYFYYVMEVADDIVLGQTITPDRYCPRTLEYELRRRGRLPIAECVRIGAGIASALGFMHQHELLHRDIKPSNIIFVNGYPKLADIGLVSTMSEARSQMGTQGFIAPEGTGTVRADVYSLGKLLYEMSTGKDRNDYPELPEELGNSREDRDLVQFNKIVLKACRSKPWHRYQSAEDLLKALLAFQFFRYDPRQRAERFLAKVATKGGLAVAVAVFVVLVWRIVQLLTHGQ